MTVDIRSYTRVIKETWIIRSRQGRLVVKVAPLLGDYLTTATRTQHIWMSIKPITAILLPCVPIPALRGRGTLIPRGRSNRHTAYTPRTCYHLTTMRTMPPGLAWHLIYFLNGRTPSTKVAWLEINAETNNLTSSIAPTCVQETPRSTTQPRQSKP